MANVTIYWKDGTSNSVPDFELSYWKGQGWSTTKPSTSSTSSSQTTNSSTTNSPTNNQPSTPTWYLSSWRSS